MHAAEWGHAAWLYVNDQSELPAGSGDMGMGPTARGQGIYMIACVWGGSSADFLDMFYLCVVWAGTFLLLCLFVPAIDLTTSLASNVTYGARHLDWLMHVAVMGPRVGVRLLEWLLPGFSRSFQSPHSRKGIHQITHVSLRSYLEPCRHRHTAVCA